jgi:hypothetical protein
VTKDASRVLARALRDVSRAADVPYFWHEPRKKHVHKSFWLTLLNVGRHPARRASHLHLGKEHDFLPQIYHKKQ